VNNSRRTTSQPLGSKIDTEVQAIIDSRDLSKAYQPSFARVQEPKMDATHFPVITDLPAPGLWSRPVRIREDEEMSGSNPLKCLQMQTKRID
jgi:hypothetical protein